MGDWLHTGTEINLIHQELNSVIVTPPSTNWAWHKATLLINQSINKTIYSGPSGKIHCEDHYSSR